MERRWGAGGAPGRVWAEGGLAKGAGGMEEEEEGTQVLAGTPLAGPASVQMASSLTLGWGGDVPAPHSAPRQSGGDL